MLKTSTISKARIIKDIAETNGFNCIKCIEAAGILPELIKSILESGDDVLIAWQQKSSYPVKASGNPEKALRYTAAETRHQQGQDIAAKRGCLGSGAQES